MSPPPYDPDARRDTPLALKLKERIRREGPITVTEYMRVCLQDPEHGYYRTRAAIGRGGDFVTAPEISQTFGELIGLWCVVVWQQMGAPTRFNLIELGPGRGTLMRDALRAARIAPGFLDALDLHFVDSNDALAGAQLAALAGVAPATQHRETFAEVALRLAGLPAILIGNEFLDTHPIAQLVAIETATGLHWRQRTVELDPHNQLQFGARARASALTEIMDSIVSPATAGQIAEYAFGYHAAICLGVLASRAPTAALYLDYGAHAPFEDTLQAVREHKPEHPLTSPGEADLTAQVRFDEVVASLTDGPIPLAVDGPVTQAEFLGSLGIVERASRLMAANPAKAAEIEIGVARLMAVPGMGSRFKAIGVRSAHLPPLPGF